LLEGFGLHPSGFRRRFFLIGNENNNE
jgi:hypothetical protein